MKALIFDLDGTLLDSMDIWNTIGSDYLKTKGIEANTTQVNKRLKTMSLIEAAKYFIDDHGLTLTVEEICNEVNRLIEDKYKNEVGLKAGVLSFLEKNAHRKMCIATATDRPLVELALGRLGIGKYFDFSITSTEVGSSKESPDIFIKAAQGLGVDIQDTIVFEDALHAIKSAKGAGFYVVGVYEQSFEGDVDWIKELANQFVYDLCEVSL